MERKPLNHSGISILYNLTSPFTSAVPFAAGVQIYHAWK